MGFWEGIFAKRQSSETPPNLAAEILARYAKGERDFDGVAVPGADFQDGHLEGARFRGSDLRGANLRGANLRGADLRMANLQDATLVGADLRGSLMVHTDLYRANLQEAQLMPRWLDDSFLVMADLSSSVIFTAFKDVVVGLGTKFHTTSLAFADLSKVRFSSEDDTLREMAQRRGVDPNVAGRCDVDLATLSDTVKMLRADLGEANRHKCDPQHLARFFRDSGMDAEILEVFFLRPLVSSERQIDRRKYDVFISFKNLDANGHSTPDSVMATELHQFLSGHNLRVFMSNASLEELGTSKFKESIDDALDAARVLVVVASSAEHVRAPWVSYEWSGFVNDILSKVKPDGEVFTYLKDISATDLPRSLRQVQSFPYGEEGQDRLYRFLTNLASRT